MTALLYQDEWVTLTFDSAAGLCRYTRTERPYGADGDIERSYGALASVVERIPPGMKLLIDVRLAPPRNDAGYEAKVGSVYLAFVSRFVRHATLVKTAAGKLQTRRMAASRGDDAHVFDDEGAALAYLNTAPGRSSPRRK